VSLNSSQSNQIDLFSAQVNSVEDILRATSAESIPKHVYHKSISQDILYANEDNFAINPALVSHDTLRMRVENGLQESDKLWPRYLVGVLHSALNECRRLNSPNCFSKQGMCITIVSDIPWNTGLGSSASVAMSASLALGHSLSLPSDRLDAVPLALLCRDVEHHVAGAKSGIMDHFAVGHAQNVKSLSF
jgi:galactokinase